MGDGYDYSVEKINYCGTLDEFYSITIAEWDSEETEEDLKYFYNNISNNLYCNGVKYPYVLYLFEDNPGKAFISLRGDTSLTSVTIPSKIGRFEVEYLDIHYCSPEIEKITISEGIKYLDGDIYPNTGLKEITIPHSVERISPYFLGDGLDYTVEKINYCGTLDEFYSLTIADWDSEETEEDLKYFYNNISNNLYCNGAKQDKWLYFGNKDIVCLNYSIENDCDDIVVPEKVGKFYINGIGMIDCNNKCVTVTVPRSVEVIEMGFVNCSDTLIKCYLNSAAHKEALKNNIDFEILDPELLKEDSTLIVDRNLGLVYGINDIQSIYTAFNLPEGSSVTIDDESEIGTGSVVKILDSDGNVLTEYVITIFGDTNGDSWYDGTDALIVNCIVSGMLTKEQVGEAIWAAADCNHDGVIDEADVALLEQAGVILSGVDQSKSEEELQTDSAYFEYRNLIDQTPNTEKTDTAAAETSDTSESATEKTVSNSFLKMIAFLKKVIDFIRNLFY